RNRFEQVASRYNPEHYLYKDALNTLRNLEAKLDQENLTRPVSPGAPAARPLSPAAQMQTARIKQLQASLEIVARAISQAEKDIASVRSRGAEMQRRLDAAPTRESELTELTRDYDILKHLYDNLLTKREDSKVAANLERRQIGENFKILDPARLPEKATSPDRL